MRILLTLIIVSVFLHSTSTAVFAKIKKRNDVTTKEILDYDCGNAFFSNEVVQNSALVGWKALPKMLKFPMVFHALFYDRRLDLLIWPIKQDGRPYNTRDDKAGIYFIVMDWNGEVKDLVVKTMSSQFIKCTKIRRSSLVPSNDIPEESNGYDCGYDLFGDKELEDLVTKAYLKIRTNFELYKDHKIVEPDSDLVHYLWPIPTAENYNSLTWTRNLYFIDFTNNKEVRDVKVKLMNGFLFSCQRVKLPERLPGDEEESFEEFGYQCGIFFFGMKYLNRSAIFSRRPQTTDFKKVYPLPYNGPPFNTDVYLYPIFPGSRLYVRGKGWKHFQVMSKSFEVIAVTVKTDSGYHLCEERTRTAETMIETTNFKCGNVEFTHQILVATAIVASERLGTSRTKFPAKYEGPDFDIPGPYLTWPLIANGFYKSGPTRFRVVVNTNFHIAGVLVNSNGELKKCKRVTGDSIPGGEMTGAIREIPRYDAWM